MMKNYFLLLFATSMFLIASSRFNRTIAHEENDRDQLEKDYMDQTLTDAKLSKDFIKNFFEHETIDTSSNSIKGRAFLKSSARRWPNNRVPYDISRDFSMDERRTMYEGLKEIQKESCIRFSRRKRSEKAWVYIKKDDWCRSRIGYEGARRHDLSMGVRCMGQNVMVHEMLHRLGMPHEQTRPDRDQYVKINWEYIEPSQRYNYWRSPSDTDRNTPRCKTNDRPADLDKCVDPHSEAFDTFGLPYDFYSVMHYPVDQTMTVLKDGIDSSRVGQLSWSELDKKKLNTAYKCESKDYAEIGDPNVLDGEESSSGDYADDGEAEIWAVLDEMGL